MKIKFTKKCSVLRRNRTHAFLTKKGIFTKNVPHGIEPAPSLPTTEPNQLRYVTLVAARPALSLASVRTSRVDLRKMRCSRWDSNSGRLHQRQLPSQLRYVTLVTAEKWLKLESVRTSGRFFYRGKHILILTISMQTWRFLLKRVWSAGAPRFFAPARTPQKPQIFGRIFFFAVLLYNAKEQAKQLPNCPPH